MGKVYEELRNEEDEIGAIKDNLERERSKPKPDKNEIERLEEKIKQKKESYFANQRRYKDLNVDVKNQVERIRSILTREKPLADNSKSCLRRKELQ